MSEQPPSDKRRGLRRRKRTDPDPLSPAARVVLGPEWMPDTSDIDAETEALESPSQQQAEPAFVEPVPEEPEPVQQAEEPAAVRATTPLPQPAPAPPPAPERVGPIELEAPEPGNSVLIAVGPSGIEGVPARYDDGTSWLRNGLSRHSSGVWVGAITGWTGVWIALWGAALGLVFGALLAGGFGLSLGYRFGVGQAASAIGVVAGAFLGLAYGALGVLNFLFVQRPFQAVASVASGAVIALVIVVAIAAFERLGLRLRGYRRLSRMEVRQIAPLVKDAADRMDLPALPRFAMADVLVPNAWTHMRTVVLTTGLLQTLSADELRAVIAHELEHWRSGDAVGLTFVWAAAWPIAVIYNLGAWLAGQPSPSGVPHRTRPGFLSFVGWLIAWPTWVIIKLLITPIVAASQRGYEYAADSAAARIGYAAQLSSALRKMSAFEGGRTGWEQAMAATHPPTELRIEALEPPKPDDFEYQEDELRAPTGHEVRRLLTFWRRSSKQRVES